MRQAHEVLNACGESNCSAWVLPAMHKTELERSLPQEGTPGVPLQAFLLRGLFKRRTTSLYVPEASPSGRRQAQG